MIIRISKLINSPQPPKNLFRSSTLSSAHPSSSSPFFPPSPLTAPSPNPNPAGNSNEGKPRGAREVDAEVDVAEDELLYERVLSIDGRVNESREGRPLLSPSEELLPPLLWLSEPAVESVSSLHCRLACVSRSTEPRRRPPTSFVAVSVSRSCSPSPDKPSPCSSPLARVASPLSTAPRRP